MLFMYLYFLLFNPIDFINMENINILRGLDCVFTINIQIHRAMHGDACQIPAAITNRYAAIKTVSRNTYCIGGAKK